MKKVVLFVIASLLCLQSALLSRDNPDLNTEDSYGLYSHFGLNTHIADFDKLTGIPNCCPQFESGVGTGLSIGALFETHIDKNLFLNLRASYSSFDGLLVKEETTHVIVDGNHQQGAFEHTMDGVLRDIGLEPMISYGITNELRLSAGFRIGYQTVSEFDQKEEISKPSDGGTFADADGNDTGLRVRNDTSGAIPNASSVILYALAGLSYDLPLNSSKSLLLSPEIYYYFGLNSYVSDVNWRCGSLRGGAAIKYRPVRLEEEIEMKWNIDTLMIESEKFAADTISTGVPSEIETEEIIDNKKIITKIYERTDTLFSPKKYNLFGSIEAFGVDSLGKEIPNPVFTIEEYISNRLDPLLNYVFFAENSSDLPDRYNLIDRKEAESFEIDNLFRESTIDIYYNILNIVGKRLKENPSANITLVGCNSGVGKEKDNYALSRNRAERVKRYLVEVWKLPPDRIKVKARGLPEKASTPIQEPDKIAENRRVELYSNKDIILKPIFIEKIDRRANPPIARFKTKIEAEAELKSWELTAFQPSAPNDKFVEQGEKSIPEKIDWRLEKNQKIIPKATEKIIYKLKLEDIKGNQKAISDKTLPVKVITIRQKRREKIGDYEIERFSLILFDFNKAYIEGNNKEVIDFIKSRIKPDSEIEISGYTDRTGDADYNKRLSERRAKSARNALNRPDATARGVGEKELLYNNKLPEGRFYCRTVEIIVETPIVE